MKEFFKNYLKLLHDGIIFTILICIYLGICCFPIAFQTNLRINSDLALLFSLIIIGFTYPAILLCLTED